MRLFKGWPPDLTHTSARWAVLQILLTIGLSSISLSLAAYALYLQFTGGKIAMPPLWFWVVLGIGVCSIIIAIVLSIIWLWGGYEDQTTKDIESMKRDISYIKRRIKSKNNIKV